MSEFIAFSGLIGKLIYNYTVFTDVRDSSLRIRAMMDSYIHHTCKCCDTPNLKKIPMNITCACAWVINEENVTTSTRMHKNTIVHAPLYISTYKMNYHYTCNECISLCKTHAWSKQCNVRFAQIFLLTL